MTSEEVFEAAQLLEDWNILKILDLDTDATFRITADRREYELSLQQMAAVMRAVREPIAARLAQLEVSLPDA